MVRERVISSVELVEAYLRRIEEVNGALNAVVQLDGKRALASAGDRDAVLARGDSIGPLHGVPFTAKENFEAAGLPMAIGVPERAEVVPGRGRHGSRAGARSRRDPAGKDELPDMGRRDRNGERGLRPHEQSVRPDADSGR